MGPLSTQKRTLAPSAGYDLPKCLNWQRCTLIDMQHCMAVGADRDKVLDWINRMRLSDMRKRDDMVNMDEAMA